MAPGCSPPSNVQPEDQTLIVGMQSGAEWLVVAKDKLMHILASKPLSRVGHSRNHFNYIRS